MIVIFPLEAKHHSFIECLLLYHSIIMEIIMDITKNSQMHLVTGNIFLKSKIKLKFALYVFLIITIRCLHFNLATQQAFLQQYFLHNYYLIFDH